MRKKIAIIGASYLQRPLVEKAKNMNLETHVFAWKEGNEVDDLSDYYYPISILEKEKILEKCKDIDIDGVVSIGSDIAMPTVNYIAEQLNLVGNSLKSTLVSTDKFEMRKALHDYGVSCPKFRLYTEPNYNKNDKFEFPVIVKPTDRSGSRGVTKVLNSHQVNDAIKKALKNSINGRVIVEEFINGREFSVEYLSIKGKHNFIAITDKITSGEPYFVELEHHQPAAISEKTRVDILNEVQKSLNCLEIKNGASHSEVLLTKQGEIKVVEIAARMGGELIGSHMTQLSTGVDFVKAVINIAMGDDNPHEYIPTHEGYSGVYYVIPRPGKVIDIIDNSNANKDVVFSKSLIKIGDRASELIDGADKRAGILVYFSTEGKINLVPEDIMEFKTVEK